ncbi:MAG: HEAT repeat domain-containing protein [Polyangiaceae bacterium]|nr:HEAT repeat domain-containing protein [Polyangiaceae bacterium]
MCTVLLVVDFLKPTRPQLALPVVAALLVCTGQARADSAAVRSSKPTAAVVHPEDFGDPAKVESALLAAAQLGNKAKPFAPAIEDLLSVGLPAHLAVSALTALSAIGSPSSSKVAAVYLSHRRSAVRVAAAKTLGATGGENAVQALGRALRSNDAEVRLAAAQSLGSVGNAQSVSDLAKAFDRGVHTAALSIARLCDDTNCDEIITRTARLSVEAQRECFVALLARKTPLGDPSFSRVATAAKTAGITFTNSELKALFGKLKLSDVAKAKIQLLVSDQVKK